MSRPVLDRLRTGSRPGLVVAPLGNLYAPLDDSQAMATLSEAWRLGVRYFDTAPLYGHGLSEQRLGGFLGRQPRDEFVLSTKVGRLLLPDPDAPLERDGYVRGLPFAPRFDYSFDGTLRSLDQSMVRLGVDRIDIAYIHDVDRRTHGSEQPARFREAMDGAYRALERLRGEGVLGAIGIGVNESKACCDAVRAGDFDCLMMAGRYTLLDVSSADELIPLCLEKKMPLVLAGVFNSGILASGAAPGARYDYRPATDALRHRVERIAQICDEFQVPLPAAALQFALFCPVAAAVVVGTRSPVEVALAIVHANTVVPPSLWQALFEEELIDLRPL